MYENLQSVKPKRLLQHIGDFKPSFHERCTANYRGDHACTTRAYIPIAEEEPKHIDVPPLKEGFMKMVAQRRGSIP